MGVIMMGGKMMLFLGGEAKVSSKELCGWGCSKTNSSALTVLSAANLFSLTSPLPKTGQKHPGQGASKWGQLLFIQPPPGTLLFLVAFHRSWTCCKCTIGYPKGCAGCLSDLEMRWRENTFPMDGTRGTSAHTPCRQAWVAFLVLRTSQNPITQRLCSHIPPLTFPWQGEALRGDPGRKVAVIFGKYHGVDLICPLHWGGHCSSSTFAEFSILPNPLVCGGETLIPGFSDRLGCWHCITTSNNL